MVGSRRDSRGNAHRDRHSGARFVISRAARELIATVAPPYLVNHSVRACAWAVELARHDGLRFDQEILYVSAIFHDIGLVPAYDLDGCYERDGAIEAERFSLEHLQPPEKARAIFDRHRPAPAR